MGADGLTLLSLDLSTTCSGWALFDIETGRLLNTGRLKPSTKGGVSKLAYPRQQLTKMVDLAHQVLALIQEVKPHAIVIEEIAGSKNRLGQKTLDGFHYVVVWVIEQYLDIVTYYDVTGSNGWRTHLRMRLSDADKAANKEAKKLNKRLAPSQQLPVIGPKHLAARHANAKFGMNLDVDLNTTDADIADAVSMGDAFLTFRFARPQKSGIV